MNDIRFPIREQWQIKDLARAPESMSIADGGDLVLYLFLLKNGNIEGRQRYGSIQETFCDLTGARFSVGLEEPLSGSTETSPSQEVRLAAVIDTQGYDIPLSLAGAGLRESLFLSAHIIASGAQVLCLDEPALNLHPTLQRKVVQRLKQRDGQTFLVTHSPHMIPVENEHDLTRIVRFQLSEGHTRVARLQLSAHPETVPQRWLREIWRGVDSPGLLFGRGVVLVEGGTEAAALPVWFAKSQTGRSRGTVEDNNILVHSVGGAQNLVTYVSFLKAFALPVAIVCDGDQFRNLGFLRQFDLTVSGSDQSFDAVRATAEAKGIFTLCDSYDQEFENLVYVHPYLEEAHREVGDGPINRGRYIAETTECPREVDALYAQLLRYLFP